MLNGANSSKEIYLPEIRDEEGHDYDVYITRQDNKNFPAFLFFDKYNRKISLRPNKDEY